MGSSFPALTVEEELGCGSFKVAYRVRNEDGERCLKVVHVPLQDGSAQSETDEEPVDSLPERVRREVLAMSQVSSSRVVPILSGPSVSLVAGKTHVWFIEPYYSGGTLDKRLTTPWSEESVQSLILGLLEAVEALWQEQIVHRDIKPENIALEEGGPVLLDLGIAYHEELTDYTDPHKPSPKTPLYAAPEQFLPRGQALIDSRTDLFCVGIVGFQALTGIHPFIRPSQEAYLDRLSHGTLDDAALDSVGVSPETRGFMARLLRPRQNQRFRDASRAISALRKVMP
ncbi:MAG: serine/threonine-protein kinase [Actinomycetota bacterium]